MGALRCEAIVILYAYNILFSLVKHSRACFWYFNKEQNFDKFTEKIQFCRVPHCAQHFSFNYVIVKNICNLFSMIIISERL